MSVSATHPCDVCGSTRMLPVYDRGRGGVPLNNMACTGCGLVQVQPRPTPQELARWYEGGAFSAEARGGHEPTRAKIDQSERSALRRYLRLDRFLAPRGGLTAVTGHALEVGCGLGSFIRLLDRCGWQVQGLEPDPDYAAKGREIYGIPIEAQAYTIDTPRPENTCDLIAHFHVIEHVISPRWFLTEQVRQLRPGGLIFVECPAVDRPYGGDLDTFFWNVHLQSFSRATLSGLLTLAGAVVEVCDFDGDYVYAIARKPPSPPPSPSTAPALPFEQAGSVVEHTLAAHRAFLDRQKKHLPAAPDPLSTIKRKVRGRLRRLLRPRKRLIHIGVHERHNAGDTLLFEAVRWLFDRDRPYDWQLEPLRRTVTPEHVAGWNQIGDALVVGGGGLFIADTIASAASGWQWPCTPEQMNAIEKPLILFAVGYNVFRGQPAMDELFRQSLTRVVEKAAFVGIRNTGSIESLKQYLPERLHAKLVYQPCPTTTMGEYLTDGQPANDRLLGVNVAFDRHWLRFKGQERPVLDRLMEALRLAHRDGWRLQMVTHEDLDRTLEPWFKRHGLPHEHVSLDRAAPDVILNHYRRADLTLGVRGHAQMIPFGLGNAICSLVTHNKLQWFLDDIGHPDWGVELLAESLTQDLTAKIQTLGRDLAATRQQVRTARKRLWGITQTNLTTIRNLIG